MMKTFRQLWCCNSTLFQSTFTFKDVFRNKFTAGFHCYQPKVLWSETTLKQTHLNLLSVSIINLPACLNYVVPIALIISFQCCQLCNVLARFGNFLPLPLATFFPSDFLGIYSLLLKRYFSVTYISCGCGSLDWATARSVDHSAANFVYYVKSYVIMQINTTKWSVN